MTALDNYINSLKINSGTLKCLRVYSSRNKFASHSIQSSREKSLKEVAKMKDFHRQREEGTSTVCEAEGKRGCLLQTYFPLEDGWRRK